jgi:hypothetical protein
MPQMQQNGPDERDGTEQVRFNDVTQLRIRCLLCGAEHAIARIADDNVDAAERAECAVDRTPDRTQILEIERSDAKAFRIACAQVAERVGTAAGSDDPIPADQCLFGQQLPKP